MTSNQLGHTGHGRICIFNEFPSVANLSGLEIHLTSYFPRKSCWVTIHLSKENVQCFCGLLDITPEIIWTLSNTKCHQVKQFRRMTYGDQQTGESLGLS